MKKLKRFMQIVLIWIVVLSMLIAISGEVLAEGTRSLIAIKENGIWSYNKGNRAIFNSKDDNKKAQKLYAYVKKGETVYFGSSVLETGFNKGYEVKVKLPSGEYKNFNITKDKGYINSKEKELNGPNYNDRKNGYNPLSITVDDKTYTTGEYEFTFYSKTKASDILNTILPNSTDTIKGNQIESLDVTVVEKRNDYYEEKSGRVWANSLSLSKGTNNSKVYVVTDDGFCYKVNYNGNENSELFFFATNRGLVDLSTNTSLYKSVYAGKGAKNPYHTENGKEMKVRISKS